MADAENPDGGSVDKILSVAKVAGSTVVVPMVRGYVRTQTTEILSQNDPERLQGYIAVDYDLVYEEMPEHVRSGLETVGPRFADQIETVLTPDAVMEWLREPQQHLDVDESTAEDLRRCASIIENTPGGRAWLRSQVVAVYDVCDIV